MQESLFNTVKKLQTEEKINVEELEIILNSDIEEVVTLCKKACLKPKTDSIGNAYFTKEDVNMLKKMKELYSQSQEIKQNVEVKIEKAQQEETPVVMDSAEKKVNFLTKAKNRIKNEMLSPIPTAAAATVQLQNQITNLENNLVNRISEVLSEKMDGFDEIIVELIRAKTENENLRQQVNTLNKQVFILKKEMASFTPLAFGLYSKKETEEL
ncbi:MAG: hypothetical protein IJ003_01160 [Candidatus Gastranaerophilales bacterium]|nr:hypothetical protein [Candidatus Gastranaerophilales bacterium]